MEEKEFNFVVNGKAHNTKYINGYIKKKNYYELHITDLKEKDFVFKLDLEDFDICKNYFWCITFVGRDGNKQPIVYYTKNRIKYYLSKYLLKIDNNNNRVIFRNRNCYDYRKSNLYKVQNNDIFLYDVGKNNKNGGNLPNGISLSTNYLGNEIGYVVNFKKNGNKKCLYFGIKKFKTLENCLQMAIKTKNILIQNQKTISS